MRERSETFFLFNDKADVLEEPGVDRGKFVDVFNRKPGEESVSDEENPLRAGDSEFLADGFEVRREILAVRAKAEAAYLQGAERFLKGFLEGAANGHRLADAFHLRGQRGVGLREFLESEARDFCDDIVDRRLEAGRRLAGDVVAEFVERVADGELGGDFRNRKSGGL